MDDRVIVYTAAQCDAPTSLRGACESNDVGIQHYPATRRIGIEDRNRTQQGTRVRMLRVRKQCVRAPHLYDPAQIHHGDAIANVLYETQIVGDEQIRQLEPILQLEHQANDLCLNRDIEGRDCFVGYDERGAERERTSDADALPLAAAEFMRETRQVRLIESHQVEQFTDARRVVPLLTPACG